LKQKEFGMQFLMLKALLSLLMFDARGLGRDFVSMYKMVSQWPVAQRTTNARAVQLICDAVNNACVWYPRRVLCLQRSAVTTCLLRNCGVPAKMVMGIQDLPFKAHAWTEVNGRAINERRDVEKVYTILERC
jgi:hypothetical protein